MINSAWQLPKGFDELLPEQARTMEYYRQQLYQLCESWGYDYLVPPFAEFVDVLTVGTGQDIASEIFQVADNHSDRMIGIRADMTPQVARIDARKLSHQQINRLFYLGTVLRARGEAHQIGSRAPFQFGAELYGHESEAADAEVIQLLLAALATLSITPITLDFGHISIFHRIQTRAELSALQMRQLYSILQSKSVSDLQDWISANSISDSNADILIALLDCCGEWTSALEKFANRVVAIDAEMRPFHDELQTLIQTIAKRHPDVSLQVDLAEFKGYRYHTGIVFAAFTQDYGAEIARGGRYDNIGKAFGQARPATGFSADLKVLLRLGTAAEAKEQARIFAPYQDQSNDELDRKIAELRTQGKAVVCALSSTDEPALFHCSHRLLWQADQWTVIECP